MARRAFSRRRGIQDVGGYTMSPSQPSASTRRAWLVVVVTLSIPLITNTTLELARALSSGGR